MANRDRGTYTFRHGVTPETMTVISSKCKLYARPSDGDSSELKQIGVVSNFDPSESRTIEPVRGIGFGDHVAELVPGMTEPMSLSVTRTAQYLSQIYNVFGYKGGMEGIVRSLRHHKWPFDILQELIISRLDPVTAEMSDVSQFISTSQDVFDEGLAAIVTSYEGCWFQDYSTSFAADTALVQENVTILCTDIVAVADDVKYFETSPDLFNMNAVSSIITSVAQGVNV
jgi:hypothetical protein